MRVRFARGVALVAVALSAAGCTKVLDRQGLEDQIAGALQSNGPALTVQCPDGVKAVAGATFQCTAKDPSGSSFAVTITQTDDKGNVTWKLTNASGSPAVGPSPTPSAATPTTSPTA
jgi:Domain of unknown function (DUF4333)